MKKNSIIYVFTFLFVTLIVSGFFSVRSEFSDPEEVFYSAIENNLKSSGVTRVVRQENAQQSLVQTIQTQTGGVNIVSGNTVLSQGEGSSETAIITESIGTPNEDYVRYAAVNTNQVGEGGGPLDFSQVLGVWGRSEPNSAIERGGELFGEATLGIVPFGTLDGGERARLLQQIRELDVYGIDFDTVDKSKVDGRTIFSYSASIRPADYVKMLQLFGEITNTSQLSDLDPNNFASSPDIGIVIEVDIVSRQISKITFTDSDRVETYSGYGLFKNYSVPAESVPVSELQGLLQSIR